MSDQEVVSDVSEPCCEAQNVMDDQQQQQSVTVADTLLPAVDENIDPVDDEGMVVTTALADNSSITADDDAVQQTALSGQSVQVVGVPVSQPVSVTSASTPQPVRITSAVPSTGHLSGVSLATKSPAIVLCQVTSGGQTIIIPRSAVGGIQLSAGTAATSMSSVTHVPVFRSAVPLRTISSEMQGIATVSSASSTAAAVVVTQTSAGIRLLRQAANGVRVIGGTNNAANRASFGVTLNRGAAPQRLAVAIAPANNTVRPLGTGSIRLVTIRNGTPVAISGVPSSGSTVASPQLKLLSPAVPMSGVRPLISVTAGVTAVASSLPASASTVSAVRQQTAVNDVQAYLRRIEELKSSQPDQGGKTPVTLGATVRTPLRAKTVVPTLTSAQQIVVLQSGSQPQLTQLVSTVNCYL